MNKIYLILLPLLLVSTPAFGSHEEDPFSLKGEPQWHLEALKEKPYLLEIAYGEYEGRHPDEQSKLKREVSPNFLASSSRFSIATSSNEGGEIIVIGKHTVRYLVSKNSDETFDLRASIKTLEGGLREINTDITLKESEWIILGGLTREAKDGASLVYSTAIRISTRANKSE